MKKGKFIIVVADYHQKYTDGMVKAARMVLQGHKVEEVRVPGTFEVPLAVKRALRKKPDAVLASGAASGLRTRSTLCGPVSSRSITSPSSSPSRLSTLRPIRSTQ